MYSVCLRLCEDDHQVGRTHDRAFVREQHDRQALHISLRQQFLPAVLHGFLAAVRLFTMLNSDVHRSRVPWAVIGSS